MIDTIIIGAGYAGIAAGKRLSETGKDFVVLEARDRVGGRTLSEVLPSGVRVDLGATWLGPTQYKIWDWVKEVNAETFDTYDSGKNILFYQGKKNTYAGTIPKIDLLNLLALGRAISKFNKLAKTLDYNKPWNHSEAEKYDSMTLQSWMDKNIPFEKAKYLFKVGVQTVFAAEPSEISLLFALFYGASGDNLEVLMGIKNGAQQTILKNGTHGLIQEISKSYEDKIVLSSPVKKIIQHENWVEVVTENQTFKAKSCILTVPPALHSLIQFEPALPQAKSQLGQRMPMGAAMKCFVIYEKPFWREKGLSGQLVSDEFPVKVTFDVGDDSKGKLLVFVEGNDARKFVDVPLEQRKQMILEKLGKFFGDEALQPIDYIDKCWTQEKWSGGCYTGLMGPNTLSHLGEELRKPFGNIHFAGTETAMKWCGYLDGAIESGYRAANEVLNK